MRTYKVRAYRGRFVTSMSYQRAETSADAIKFAKLYHGAAAGKDCVWTAEVVQRAPCAEHDYDQQGAEGEQ